MRVAFGRCGIAAFRLVIGRRADPSSLAGDAVRLSAQWIEGKMSMRIEFRFTTLGFGGIGFTGYRRARRRIPAISVAVITVCAASSAFAQAGSPTITDQYFLNFYDYRQPDPLMGTTAVTLAQGVGGGFLPAPFP